MSKFFQEPGALLSAYFRNKGETDPTKDALWLLKVFVQSNYRWRNDEVRASADNVLKRANFDVCDLAENFLGIDVYINDLSGWDAKAGAKVFGVARPAARVIEICERAESYEPLFRATVMHEVAHIVKHSARAGGAMCYSPTARRRPPEEAEADRFMANTLLPKPLLFLAAVTLAERKGLNPREAFGGAETKRGRFQWKRHYFPFLINELCVSRELIALKLLHLGIISPNTFDYHRSYSLSTRWKAAQPSFNFRYAVEQAAKIFCRPSSS